MQPLTGSLMNTVSKRVLFYFVFFLLSTFVFAHPHVFIESSFIFVFNSTGLSGIQVKWILDEMFSSTIMMDYDRNRNNFFEESEIKAVEQGAFANLRNYNYFLHIQCDYVNNSVSYVTNFKAEITNNRVVYYFFVPLGIKAKAAGSLISVGCYDQTYFCDISYAKGAPVRLRDSSRYACSWKIVDDKKNAYWGGFIIPKIVLLEFRKKDE
jgi:ABC-type uncharacterized transport system substrate-binding protein